MLAPIRIVLVEFWVPYNPRPTNAPGRQTAAFDERSHAPI
jgi:hypothetical protein